MDNIEIVKEWFFIGDKDLESAIFLKNMHPVPLEIICFHCQQCAEKYLKGYLSFKEDKIEKIHNLIEIKEMCMNHGVDFKKIVNFVKKEIKKKGKNKKKKGNKRTSLSKKNEKNKERRKKRKKNTK